MAQFILTAPQREMLFATMPTDMSLQIFHLTVKESVTSYCQCKAIKPERKDKIKKNSDLNAKWIPVQHNNYLEEDR